jgi:hypothetical protein
LASDAIHPLKLNLDLIWHLEVVVHRNTLKPIGDQGLKSCMEPDSEVLGALVVD